MFDTTHSVEHGTIVGAQTDYVFTFETLVDGSEIRLSVLKLPGAVETPLVNPADFTVVVNSTGLGGTVTIINAVNYDTWRYTIYRETVETQDTALANTGQAAYPNTELALDRITRWAQEQESDLDNRALILEITDETNVPATVVTQLLALIGSTPALAREALLWDSAVDASWIPLTAEAQVDIGFFDASVGDPRLAAYSRLRVEVSDISRPPGAPGGSMFVRFLDEYGVVADTADYTVRLTRYAATLALDERLNADALDTVELFNAGTVEVGANTVLTGGLHGEFDIYLGASPIFNRAAYRLHSLNSTTGSTYALNTSEGQFAFSAPMPTSDAIPCGIQLNSGTTLNLSAARARVWGVI